MGPPLRKKTQDKDSIMNSSTSKDSSSKYSCNTPNFNFDDNISFNGNRAEFISQYKNDNFQEHTQDFFQKLLEPHNYAMGFDSFYDYDQQNQQDLSNLAPSFDFNSKFNDSPFVSFQQSTSHYVPSIMLQDNDNKFEELDDIFGLEKDSYLFNQNKKPLLQNDRQVFRNQLISHQHYDSQGENQFQYKSSQESQNQIFKLAKQKYEQKYYNGKIFAQNSIIIEVDSNFESEQKKTKLNSYENTEMISDNNISLKDNNISSKINQQSNNSLISYDGKQSKKTIIDQFQQFQQINYSNSNNNKNQQSNSNNVVNKIKQKSKLILNKQQQHIDEKIKTENKLFDINEENTQPEPDHYNKSILCQSVVRQFTQQQELQQKIKYKCQQSKNKQLQNPKTQNSTVLNKFANKFETKKLISNVGKRTIQQNQLKSSLRPKKFQFNLHKSSFNFKIQTKEQKQRNIINFQKKNDFKDMKNSEQNSSSNIQFEEFTSTTNQIISHHQSQGMIFQDSEEKIVKKQPSKRFNFQLKSKSKISGSIFCKSSVSSQNNTQQIYQNEKKQSKKSHLTFKIKEKPKTQTKTITEMKPKIEMKTKMQIKPKMQISSKNKNASKMQSNQSLKQIKSEKKSNLTLPTPNIQKPNKFNPLKSPLLNKFQRKQVQRQRIESINQKNSVNLKKSKQIDQSMNINTAGLFNKVLAYQNKNKKVQSYQQIHQENQKKNKKMFTIFNQRNNHSFNNKNDHSDNSNDLNNYTRHHDNNSSYKKHQNLVKPKFINNIDIKRDKFQFTNIQSPQSQNAFLQNKKTKQTKFVNNFARKQNNYEGDSKKLGFSQISNESDEFSGIESSAQLSEKQSSISKKSASKSNMIFSSSQQIYKTHQKNTQNQEKSKEDLVQTSKRLISSIGSVSSISTQNFINQVQMLMEMTHQIKRKVINRRDSYQRMARKMVDYNHYLQTKINITDLENQLRSKSIGEL